MPSEAELLLTLRDLIAADIRRWVDAFRAAHPDELVRAFAIECDDINTNLRLAIETERQAAAYGPRRDPRGFEVGAWEFEGEAWTPIHWPMYDTFGSSPTLAAFLGSMRDRPFPPRTPEDEPVPNSASSGEDPDDEEDDDPCGIPAEPFAEACIAALFAAREALERLPRAPDFCSFVQFHDAPREEDLELFQRTVTPELFATLFPREAAEDDWLDEAVEWPVEVRARAAIAIVVGRELPQRALDLGFPPSYILADRLMTYVGWDIAPALVEEVLRLVEPRIQRGQRDDLSAPRSPAFEAAVRVLWLPADFGPAPEEHHASLRRLEATLRAASHAGVRVGNVLRTLEFLMKRAGLDS